MYSALSKESSDSSYCSCAMYSTLASFNSAKIGIISFTFPLFGVKSVSESNFEGLSIHINNCLTYSLPDLAPGVDWASFKGDVCTSSYRYHCINFASSRSSFKFLSSLFGLKEGSELYTHSPWSRLTFWRLTKSLLSGLLNDINTNYTSFWFPRNKSIQVDFQISIQKSLTRYKRL